MSAFYFFYQQKGGEDEWKMDLASERDSIVSSKKPAFTTVLDLNLIPDDGDWSKTRYRGPFYADFDAGDDLPLVCEQFGAFLLKLDSELDFDLTQARLYASGSKGFHIEIDQACFMPKVPAQGTPWLPYVYREVAQSLMVDTLDLAVYTGKRGRMWRTVNVQRDNGKYKVPLTLEDAMSMTPDLYREVIKEPRTLPPPTPATCNSKFSMLFERSREKMVSTMRGRKKRQEQANKLLDPWKKAKKHPPTIEMMMRGENIADSVGFQALSMQMAIYATSVGMPLDEFLDRCQGMCESHVSDSHRYNTLPKRREELARMYRYMEENSLYEFDTAPLLKMLRRGTAASDLGQMAQEDEHDTPAPTPTPTTDTQDGDAPSTTVSDVDVHRNVRKGFFMNAEGMFRSNGQNVDSICRATLRNVESFYDVERQIFQGYEFDLCVKGRKPQRAMLAADAFTSITPLRKFFVNHQLSFQGAEPDAAALLDIMAEKAGRNGRVYTYPREGFVIIDNPESEDRDPVKVYLTQEVFLSSVPEDDERYFRLRYRPTAAMSSYMIDIHRAPALGLQHADGLHDVFGLNRPDVVANLLGWFVAAHYRSAYLHLFRQFPLLHLWGQAGSGKTKTVELLARMHWYRQDISVKSAMSCTPFALDSHASSSTSAPLILDEYKPRELRTHKGKYEKFKDVLKASYVGADIGERGTINRGPENTLSIIKSKATAPIVFMAEAIEMETAIVERSVIVPMSSESLSTSRIACYERLKTNPEPLSALGRAIVEMGFALNLDAMRVEMQEIQERIRSKLPNDEKVRRMAPRLIFNRAVVIHGLSTLKRILQTVFGSEFDSDIDGLLDTTADYTSRDAQVVQIHAMSEISKVLSRIALNSRDTDALHWLRPQRDYVIGDGWVELKVERAYDSYRRYCATINDTPLFDNIEAFGHALNTYGPVVDRVCASSELREDGTSERIVRFDMNALVREGVQAFKI